MHAIRQKCRPKHQVLILKCYPRTTKGAVDVKPNSSELSYLLYYATTRRSKVQKVGAFLEKKTASDVWRARIGYVYMIPPCSCNSKKPFWCEVDYFIRQ
jgi:protein EFR3